MARPKKFTKDQVKKAVEKSKGFYSEAARILSKSSSDNKCDYRTIKSLIIEYGLEQDFKDAAEVMHEAAKLTITAAAIHGDVSAAKYIVSSLNMKEFGHRETVIGNEPEKNEIKVSKLDPGDIDRIAEIIDKKNK